MSGTTIVNPARVIIYDENLNPVVVADGDPLPAAPRAYLIAGYEDEEGNNVHVPQVTAERRLVVDPSQVTSPVSDTATQTALGSLLAALGGGSTGGVGLDDVATVLAAIFTRLADGSNVVSDGGGSLTVDATALPLPTGAATSALQTQPGVDIGDVTVNNAAGAGAVNIQDGGNVITVDGTVAVTNANLDAALSTLATQATLAQIKAKTDNIDNATSTLATQVTAAAIETILTAIRDTAGIKKIVDALPAGTNAIGKLAANSGVDIGDVDITSIAAGDNNIGNVDIVTVPADPFGLNADASSATGSISAKLRFIASVLSLIKDTDGIKKITDALPAGTAHLGEVSTVVPGTPGNRYGRATLATANVAVAVTYTSYTEMTTNGQRSLVSSSANDTSAGTGARTTDITYFDQTCAGPYTETVTMNGTTPVATVASNICFLEELVCKTFGSGNDNDGTISMYSNNAGGGTLIATISNNVFGQGATAGDSQTYSCRHYVAAGATCRVTGISGYADAPCVFILRTKDPTGSGVIQKTAHLFEVNGSQGGVRHQFQSPLQFTGPARLVLFAIPASNNTGVSGSFDFSEAT